MLTRVYIDNFRCFVNFEYRPARKQLILGGNGSGKSSFLAAMLAIRQFAIVGKKAEDVLALNQRTRWLTKHEQTFELEVQLEGAVFVYRLVLGRWFDVPIPKVQSETLLCDTRTIFDFTNGEVHLFNEQFEPTVTYPFNESRSAFETMSPRQGNSALMRFKKWLAGLFCFSINPRGMGLLAEYGQPDPEADLSNFAAWYKHLSLNVPSQMIDMGKSLSSSLAAFGNLKFENSETSRWLVAGFGQVEGKDADFGFDELSDGQRCLICLYAILHFLIAKGYTVILDEPDNFVSLREIQPWLTAVSDAIEDGNGQVLLISHHPEIIDQWAPENGVRFVRDGVGPARVEKFIGDPESSLSPSELIARGWDE